MPAGCAAAFWVFFFGWRICDSQLVFDRVFDLISLSILRSSLILSHSLTYAVFCSVINHFIYSNVIDSTAHPVLWTINQFWLDFLMLWVNIYQMNFWLIRKTFILLFLSLFSPTYVLSSCSHKTHHRPRNPKLFLIAAVHSSSRTKCDSGRFVIFFHTRTAAHATSLDEHWMLTENRFSNIS